MHALQRGGRRHRAAALTLALTLALALAPGAARAQAADAPALEAELRDWLAALLGPQAGLGNRPVRLTPQDGHLALEIPLAGALAQGMITLHGPPLTATASRLDGGRWALDDIRLPSPMRVTAAGARGETVWTFTLRDQDQHAVLDPSLATTSTWDGTIGGYATSFQGPGGDRHSEAEHVRTHVVWQPAGGGRIDVSETASSELLSSNSRSDKLGLISFSAAHSQLSAHIAALTPGRVPPLLHAVLDITPVLLSGADAAPPQARLTPAQRTALATALDVAGDLFAGFTEQVTMENVRVQARNVDATMRSLELGASASAPDGRLRLRLHLAMDGFDSGALPAGKLRDYLPRHVALTPRLSGLPTDRVLALLHRAVASGGGDPALEAEALSLMREGPLVFGMDEMAADFGPATLRAAGELRIAGPGQVTGQARIAATGLDALIRDAQGVPMLRQALPALIFLKGIGEPEGEATVWNLVYDAGRMTVNGTDLSQMMPGK